MNDLAIETHALHKHYGDIHAVDGLDMHVPRGAVYGFLGRNGAGKTTTIRMLAGLAHASGGDMRVLGLDPRTRESGDPRAHGPGHRQDADPVDDRQRPGALQSRIFSPLVGCAGARSTPRCWNST